MSPPEEHEERRWLLGLCDLAQQWVEANGGLVVFEARPGGEPVPIRIPMDGYVNVIFAFGLAQLREADAAREMLARADKVLAGQDEAHTFLLEAYRYRITQALKGKPHTGPLPAELLDTLDGKGPLVNYVTDRLRRLSRILEPDQEIDPYRTFQSRISELDGQLSEITDLADPREFAGRVQRLLQAPLRSVYDPAESRAKIIDAALEAAPRVGEAFAQEMLNLSLKVYDALPEPADANALAQRAAFLEKALFVAVHFGSADHINQQVARFEQLLQVQHGWRAILALEKMAGRCFRGLCWLGMRDQIDRLLTRMAALVLEGKDLASVDASGLRALLLVAGEWYFFGREGQAEPMLQAARALLFKGELPWGEQTSLACAYARTVARAPTTVARQRLEEMFMHLKGVQDLYTTRSHFSLSQLGVVESVVLAVTAAAEAPA